VSPPVQSEGERNDYRSKEHVKGKNVVHERVFRYGTGRLLLAYFLIFNSHIHFPKLFLCLVDHKGYQYYFSYEYIR